MYEIEKETLRKSLKPFDVVDDGAGSIGIIQEVSVNNCQPSSIHQIRYSVRWIAGPQEKLAWWKTDELKRVCNLFVVIAEMSTHPSGNNERSVKDLFQNWG